MPTFTTQVPTAGTTSNLHSTSGLNRVESIQVFTYRYLYIPTYLYYLPIRIKRQQLPLGETWERCELWYTRKYSWKK